jgi:hypothetical protein
MMGVVLNKRLDPLSLGGKGKHAAARPSRCQIYLMFSITEL